MNALEIERKIRKGSNMCNITADTLKNLIIPMIPMEEQKKIGKKYKDTILKELDLQKQILELKEYSNDLCEKYLEREEI